MREFYAWVGVWPPLSLIASRLTWEQLWSSAETCHTSTALTALYRSTCQTPGSTITHIICKPSYPANTKHLYNICTASAQRLRRWSNIVQMLYICVRFTGYSHLCWYRNNATTLSTQHPLVSFTLSCELLGLPPISNWKKIMAWFDKMSKYYGLYQMKVSL